MSDNQSDYMKKFANILSFIDKGPYSLSEIRQLLPAQLSKPEHLVEFIDMFLRAAQELPVLLDDIKWAAHLLGTNQLVFITPHDTAKGVVTLSLVKDNDVIKIGTEPDLSMRGLMDFVIGAPYTAETLGPALSKVSHDQGLFQELLREILGYIDRFNNKPGYHGTMNHLIEVSMNQKYDSMCFHIGKFAGAPIGVVYANVVPVGDELRVGGIAMAGQRSSGHSTRNLPIDQLVMAGPIPGRDLASRLMLVTVQSKAHSMVSEIFHHAGLNNVGDQYSCFYRFSIQGNELIIEIMAGITVTSNDTPKLIYRLMSPGGKDLFTVQIGELLALHPSIGSAHRRGSSYGSPDFDPRWGGPFQDHGYEPFPGMAEPFGFRPGMIQGRFSIPRWGMYEAPGGFGGWRTGTNPLHIAMPVRSYQEIERVVELLAERSPVVHKELALLQTLMDTGTGTPENPYEQVQFVFKVEPAPMGSLVTLSKYATNTGTPLSQYTFIVAE